MKKIVLITGNKNKLKEFQTIFSKEQIELSNINVDLPELQGPPDGLQIAKDKAIEAYNQIKQPLIIEDTSLCFNSMNNLPGPYIKWFLKSMSLEDIVKLLDSFEDKTAYAQCIITYIDENMKPETYVGRVKGQIIYPKGDRNFGWDAIFQPENFQQTYAEMDNETKNQISHRKLAIQKFIDEKISH